MDKLKTRVLFISLVLLMLVSVSAVAAADVDDLTNANQEDFDLSNEIDANLDEVVADQADASDNAKKVPLTQSQLKEGDNSVITFAFYHLKNSGWVNETTTRTVATGSTGSNGNWLKATSQGYSLPLNPTYQDREWTLLYWIGPSVSEHPDTRYEIGDRVYYTADGTDFTMQFTAVYSVEPSQVTAVFSGRQNADGPAADGTIVRQFASTEDSITIYSSEFDAMIKGYETYDVETSDAVTRYTFDHWEDEEGNPVSGDQVLPKTGSDYSVKYTAVYTSSLVTTNVTVVYNMKDSNGNDISTNESKVLNTPQDTFDVTSTNFQTQIAGHDTFTLNGVDYEFDYWTDEAGNNLTKTPETQSLGWTGENYTVAYTAVYKGKAPSTVTVIFSNMSGDGSKNKTYTRQVYYGGSWTFDETYFNQAIEGYKNFTYDTKYYNFSHWVDENGAVANPPYTFEWADHDQSIEFKAVYDVYDVSKVTLVFDNMSDDSNKVNFTESNVLGPGMSWIINQDKFNGVIANYRSFEDDDGYRYTFTQWVDEMGNPIAPPYEFEWTGENYTVTYHAQYDKVGPSKVTIFFNKTSKDGPGTYQGETNTIAIGDTWTILKAKFDNQLEGGFKEFDYNNSHYVFNHWENETGDTVTEQTFPWTGYDYERSFVAIYDIYPDTTFTAIWHMNNTNGPVNKTEESNFTYGQTKTLTMKKFNETIQPNKEFHANGVSYEFDHWEDAEGNTITDDQVFSYTGENITVEYFAFYNEFPDSVVTVVWHMNSSSGPINSTEKETLTKGTAWIINEDKFDKKIAGHEEYHADGVTYIFDHWEDEDSNPIAPPYTFDWTGENYTVNYYAVYNSYPDSEVTVIWNMKDDGDVDVATNESNTLEKGDSWTINDDKFNNKISNYKEYRADGVTYIFDHWEDEEGNAVTGDQTFPWTGEDYIVNYYAIYNGFPDSEVTVIWNMKDDGDVDVATNESNTLEKGDSWTINDDKFNNKISNYKEYHADGVTYIFDHWEDEEGNAVSGEQTFDWTGEDYTVNYYAIYNSYPDSVVTVIWNMMSSNGKVNSTENNTLEKDDSWTLLPAKFDNKIANYKEFDYKGSHYTFNHWEDEEGNTVTGDQTLPWTGENYTVTYTAVYDIEINPIDTTVSNESEGGKIGQTVDVTFTVNDEYGDPVQNGTLTVTVEGKEYTAEVTDGKVTFNDMELPPAEGTYSYEVNYEGNDWYNPSVGQLNLTVQKVDVIIAVPEVINYTGAVVDVVVKFTDEFGKPVTAGTATFTIDYTTKLSNRLFASAETYTAEVSDGQATFKDITLGDPGIYPSKVEYSGTDYYNPAENESDVIVLKLDTTTESDDVSGKSGDKVDITAEITDENGNPVKNGTATLTVDGKQYTAEVVDGIAVFKDVELPSQSMPATIVYAGNDYYYPSNTTIQITVEEEPQPNPNPNPEPVPVIGASVKGPVAGNPIAMLLVVLLTMVSTISIRRK